MKKWQIQVYFQVRLKETITLVEQKSIPESNGRSLTSFRFNFSTTVFETLNKLTSHSYFISLLFPKFWKLYLQLLTKYESFQLGCIEKAKDPKRTDMDFYFDLLHDAFLMRDKLQNFPENHFINLDYCDDTKVLLKNRFNEIVEQISENRVIRDSVSAIFTEECRRTLKDMKNVIAFYRRSTKAVFVI